jgi:hypothetical protein
VARVSLAVPTLSDVSVRESSAEQIIQMRACTEQGGGLLVPGGPLSLGLGGFRDMRVAEWPPVDAEPHDLAKETRG